MRIHVHTARYPAWIVWLVGIPVAIAAAFLALFLFTFFLIFFGLVAVAFGLRLWWLRRKLRQESPTSVLKGEYAIVREHEPAGERQRLPRGNPKR